MAVSIYQQTNAGKLHTNNEDNVLSVAFASSDEHYLALVSDGVGGHAFGEVASQTAVDIFADLVKKNMLDVAFDISMRDAMLEMSARRAHLTIAEKAKQGTELCGMSCTLIAALLDPSLVGFVNVGDSRLYLFSGNTLQQVSRDQTIARALLKDGQISADELTTHPDRNVLQFSLGVEGGNCSIEPQVGHFAWHSGDKILLCSDGLTDMLPDDVIEHTLQQYSGDGAVQQLIEQALTAGGKDNITIVLCENGV
ncbi:MAG: serine/threonine protein phosphatase PrpC [Paraglaciecola sp.]